MLKRKKLKQNGVKRASLTNECIVNVCVCVFVQKNRKEN